MDKKSVIVVEDDKRLLNNIVEFLEFEGFEVKGAACALDFFQLMATAHFDIAIIDINLPDKSGFEIIESLRPSSSMGMIVLTARSGIEDRLKGYEVGADYYFVKPVDLRELIAAIRNFFSRFEVAAPRDTQPESPSWLFEPGNWVLTSPEGERIELTSKELAFLDIVISEYPGVVSRDHLQEQLNYHTSGAYGNRALDVIIARLRKKIKSRTGQSPIKTARSVGFCFAANVIKK